jgi:hypothetical protein
MASRYFHPSQYEQAHERIHSNEVAISPPDDPKLAEDIEKPELEESYGRIAARK